MTRVWRERERGRDLDNYCDGTGLEGKGERKERREGGRGGDTEGGREGQVDIVKEGVVGIQRERERELNE